MPLMPAKRNKRLTIALTMTVVAMAAVVTMAATGEKISEFDMVTAGYIGVTNKAGDVVVTLGAADNGNGVVYTKSAKGKKMVDLSAIVSGGGAISTYQPNGNELVMLGTSANGGLVEVFNKTGEGIAQMRADEYGNGVVWAGNRKGKGRTLKPGP